MKRTRVLGRGSGCWEEEHSTGKRCVALGRGSGRQEEDQGAGKRIRAPGRGVWHWEDERGTGKRSVALPDLAGVVVDAEAARGQAGVGDTPGVLRLLALVVLVRGQKLVELGEEGVLVDHAGPQALLVQHGQDPAGALCHDGWCHSRPAPANPSLGYGGSWNPKIPALGGQLTFSIRLQMMLLSKNSTGVHWMP